MKEKTFFHSWPWWRWLLTGLSTAALALSVYLSWHYLTDGSIIGCGGGSPCDKVLNSRWSAIGGILPVSGLAAGVYLAMLTASLFIGPAAELSIRRLAGGFMLVLAGAASGSAVWFIIVQKWFIGAFCPYCMTAHILGLLLAVLVIWKVPMQFCTNSTDRVQSSPVLMPDIKAAVPGQDVFPDTPRRIVSPFYGKGLFMLGLMLAGILAVCQIAFAPAPVNLGGKSQDNLPALDPHTVPLVGPPDAVYVVRVLFDFQCSHCQKMYFMLNEAVGRCGGELAFALCPTPLNSQCNPYVLQDVDAFKNSCQLAKISLTVWLANRQAFPIFVNWMFSFESGDRWRPRSLDAAKTKAVELVGRAKFDAAFADPWIDQYLQTSVQIYGSAIPGGSSAIPKLVFGSRWVVPQPDNTDDLMKILQDSLEVPISNL